MEAILVFTTTETREEAENLTKIILDSKKAACVQIEGRIQSSYYWKGEIETSEEYKISLKTFRENFKDIERLIKENHSYETPEIIAIPIANISEDYKKWMESELIANS